MSANTNGEFETDFSEEFENPEFSERARRKYREQQREETVSSIQAASTKDWLQRKIEEQAVTIDIFDRQFLFVPMGTEQVADIVERGTQLDDDENIGDNAQLFRDVIGLLAEHCTDPDMDREAFGSMPPMTLQEVFESVVESTTDVDEDRIEQFRHQ